MPKHLKVSDYKVMPWKNGLGTTVELAVAPHRDGREDSLFLWRISMAFVIENGPFSYFRNIDRHIMILEGKGLILVAKGEGTYVIDRPLMVTRFSGDCDVTGKLIDGPVIDLNVMVDRRYARVDVDVEKISNVVQIFYLKATITFFYLPDASPPLSIWYEGREIRLKGGQSYMITKEDQARTLKLTAESHEPSYVVVISLTV